LYLAQIIEHLKSGLVIKRNHKNQRNLVLVSIIRRSEHYRKPKLQKL